MSRRILPLVLIAVSTPVVAQLSTGVAPPRVEKVVRPSTSVADAITFSNDSETAVMVTASIVDFDVLESGEVVEMPAGTHPQSVAPHIRIRPAEALVGPGERFHFRYAMDAPEEFTQLRGMVLLTAEPRVEETEQPRVVFANTMGIPLYLENREAEPGRLLAENLDWTRSGDRVRLDLDLQNSGERNVRPAGFVRVRSARSGFDETFRFNPGTEAVLPGHERRWKATVGPVPEGEPLAVELSFSTSARTRHTSRHDVSVETE